MKGGHRNDRIKQMCCAPRVITSSFECACVYFVGARARLLVLKEQLLCAFVNVFFCKHLSGKKKEKKRGYICSQSSAS